MANFAALFSLDNKRNYERSNKARMRNSPCPPIKAPRILSREVWDRHVWCKQDVLDDGKTTQ